MDRRGAGVSVFGVIPAIVVLHVTGEPFRPDFHGEAPRNRHQGGQDQQCQDENSSNETFIPAHDRAALPFPHQRHPVRVLCHLDLHCGRFSYEADHPHTVRPGKYGTEVVPLPVDRKVDRVHSYFVCVDGKEGERVVDHDLSRPAPPPKKTNPAGGNRPPPCPPPPRPPPPPRVQGEVVVLQKKKEREKMGGLPPPPFLFFGGRRGA